MVGGFVGGALGLIGVIISIFFSYKLNVKNQEFQIELKEKEHNFELKLKDMEKENEVWLKKYNLLIQLMSFKHDIGSKEFSSALNGVVALFHDSREVMDALKGFYNIASKPKEQKSSNEQNEKLIEVFSSIYAELDMDENLDKSFLEKTFNVDENLLNFYQQEHLLLEREQAISLARIADVIDPNDTRRQIHQEN